MKKAEGARKLWDKYKYAGLVALIGAVLLLWPSGNSNTGRSGSSAAETVLNAEAGDLQEQMEEDFFYYDLKVYYICPECRKTHHLP